MPGRCQAEANQGLVPAFLYRLRNDQHVDAEAILVDEVRLDVLRHDMTGQWFSAMPGPASSI